MRLEVALTPANLQAGKDIGLKLKEMCTLSLTESLAYDMDNVSALLRELPSVLTKLKSGKFEDSEDVAKGSPGLARQDGGVGSKHFGTRLHVRD